MNPQLVYLKVKIKSLAEEAKIIRAMEKKATKRNWTHVEPRLGYEFKIANGLHYHRTHDVRNEARASQLAYGFLRGKKYATLEIPKVVDDYNYKLIQKRTAEIVKNFGGYASEVEAWFAAEA